MRVDRCFPAASPFSPYHAPGRRAWTSASGGDDGRPRSPSPRPEGQGRSPRRPGWSAEGDESGRASRERLPAAWCSQLEASGPTAYLFSVRRGKRESWPTASSLSGPVACRARLWCFLVFAGGSARDDPLAQLAPRGIQWHPVASSGPFFDGGPAGTPELTRFGKHAANHGGGSTVRHADLKTAAQASAAPPHHWISRSGRRRGPPCQMPAAPDVDGSPRNHRPGRQLRTEPNDRLAVALDPLEGPFFVLRWPGWRRTRQPRAAPVGLELLSGSPPLASSHPLRGDSRPS